jgi:glutamyl-Q tRNA(Asp) synthetase
MCSLPFAAHFDYAMLHLYDCIDQILRSRGEMSLHLVTRFAPSPTGLLHLGHAWSAMLAHDRARGVGGQFLLRIEDIDQTRCRPEFVDAIYRDLDWLGLGWDGPAILQSGRAGAYDAALQSLITRGLAYRCWCTRAEIAESVSAPQGPAGALYPGTCRGKTVADTARAFCWRLDAEAAMNARESLAWVDTRVGPQIATLAAHGDVVLARKDAMSSYHLAVTIDDAAQGVTDIVRGQDLFSATHVHRVLQSLLGLPTPRYHHHPLLIGRDGQRLAKRKHAPSLASLRAAGVDPVRLIDGMREGRFPVGFGCEEA